MTHTITWDHSECEHDTDPDEHWCLPIGTVACDDPECFHRNTCDDGGCEYLSVCECGGTGLHPTERHDNAGHRLAYAECNALLFIDAQGGARDSYCTGDGEHEDCQRMNDFHDGPVAVEWGDEAYTWSYYGEPGVEIVEDA